ncbi:MAG TPA: hypothetical protein EYN67_18005 [Flavobacteriales bacterium]|nr:hypothetical protein [Flavobacteriales bacterium]
MKDLTEDQLYARTLSSHIDNNAEAVKRLMMIVVAAIPHLDDQIAGLMNEWHSINHTINAELKAELKGKSKLDN